MIFVCCFYFFLLWTKIFLVFFFGNNFCYKCTFRVPVFSGIALEADCIVFKIKFLIVTVVSLANNCSLLFKVKILFSVISACGGLIVGDLGAVYSPNYPLQYPPNTVCDWVIVSTIYWQLSFDLILAFGLAPHLKILQISLNANYVLVVIYHVWCTNFPMRLYCGKMPVWSKLCFQK